MQLFDLVNSLLTSSPVTAKRRLHICTYSVTPLSGDSGILGWVQNTNTFHTLLSEYRNQTGERLDKEQKLMDEFAPSNSSNRLTTLQRIEVFKYALDRTHGRDLYNIFWNTSRNAQLWLERRIEYTRSLAVMSMVC